MTGIFTLDSIMALVIATVVLTMSIYLLAQPKTQTTDYLYQLSLDLLTVSEEKHFLQDALRGDFAGMEKLKAALPPQVCFQLSVKNESNALVYSGENGCVVGDVYAVGRRTFVYNEGFYVSEMRVWER